MDPRVNPADLSGGMVVPRVTGGSPPLVTLLPWQPLARFGNDARQRVFVGGRH